MVTPERGPALARAYDACLRVAHDHYENFPVASTLLPGPMRPHVAAVYAFSRLADDFADEGEREAAERLALLDAWLACLHGEAPAATLPAVTGEVFAALRATICACDLPVSLFEDLLSAFRQDVTTRRYASWADVLDYCRRSANPVGRLVLRIAGYRDEALDRSSDAVCSALQLTNFWQDLERDWRNGRLYLPLDECRSAGADPADLDAGRMTAAWQEVLQGAASMTAGLFDEGRLVCTRVGGRLGLELRLTWLGGRRILERLERAGFDVFQGRPALGRRDVPVLLGRLLRWRRA
jgi:squalene synthase HpnC